MSELDLSAGDEPVQFVDEPIGAGPAPPPLDPWRILIVDDEPDVHASTQIALRDCVIEGRPLALLHAYSAQEAYGVLAQDPSIAVILLDVVMESENAGLELVRRIRQELNNQAVRIILRTGQPGYAPELETIRTFDINDYRTKSELTRVRLLTSLIVAIRSYWQIQQLELGRRGLELIVEAGASLMRLRALQQFAEGVIHQLCALLGTLPDGLICASAPQCGDGPPRIIAAAGRYRELLHRPLDELPDEAARRSLEGCLRERRHRFNGGIGLYFETGEGQRVAAYLAASREPEPVTRHLLDVFCVNIAAGLENVLLHHRLLELAYYDRLTGLPNRNRFIQLIEERAKTPGMVLALLDIDDFSEIALTLDQEFGDRVLKETAERLRQCLDPTVALGRVGSNAFGLLGPAALLSPERLEGVFAEPLRVGDESLRLSATSSLIELTGDAVNGEELLKDAAIALKQGKRLRRGKASYFSKTLRQAAQERMHLLGELRAAFSAQRLRLFFQPQVELASGQPTGAEALLRWEAEPGRWIPPDRFIPLAEQSGLIVPLGAWVLRSACQVLARWAAQGHAGVRLAVNVSQIQFREPDFVALVEESLAESGIDPTRLELELTESVAMDHPEESAAKLAALRRLGVAVAIDDFGTGYSALGVLQQLPVDRLKIDRAFVRELEGEAPQSRIVQLIIALGHECGLGLIAEGIETESQRRYLLSLGCQEGQGFLFGRPMPLEQFEAWLSERTRVGSG